VQGPFASLRLKHWRRGIQDVEYLAMAAATDPGRVQAIVDAIVPSILWDLGVEDPSDPTWVLADISWPTDPDVWEAARAELADIIEGAMPTSINEADALVPRHFALQPNYPNPFNPSTTIRYAVPASQHVTLRIYDLLGRPVATLVDGWQQAGRYTASFDATHLASGVYLYRLEAGDFVETRTMLLVK